MNIQKKVAIRFTEEEVYTLTDAANLIEELRSKVWNNESSRQHLSNLHNNLLALIAEVEDGDYDFEEIE